MLEEAERALLLHYCHICYDPCRTREEAERALNTMNGTFLGHRRIRCGWAQHKQDTSSCNFGCIDRADPTNANVYVGNVAADVRPSASSCKPLPENCQEPC